MAIYRQIHISIWQDGFFLELTPEEKYFYIYLLSNSKTAQCGIYELPLKIMETETGYNKETIEKLINRFGGYNKIVYDKETMEICIVNWLKYNKISGPKVKKCVEKELKNIKSTKLVTLFLNKCKEYGYEISYNMEINTPNNLGSYARLYEQNIGLINGIGKEWLVDICEKIDIELFKKSIEIATNRGVCNKGYINGIINQWIENNIKSIDDLNAYEVSSRNKGENNARTNREKHRKTKHAFPCENEDESIYSKPTAKQLEDAKKLMEGI